MLSKPLDVIGTLLLGCLLALPAAAQSSHPLVGRIFDTRTGALAAIGDATLIPQLFPCHAITLLGEVHDNGEHHKMRADLIAGADKTPCRPRAVVFEHINADQQGGLDKFDDFDSKAQGADTTDDLFRFIDWDKSGWPSAGLFAPLMRQAIAGRRPIFAGNPSRDMTRKVSKDGVGALDPAVASRLGLDKPLDAALDDALLTELGGGHCGMMPKTAFGSMAMVQRYRDASIADAALTAAKARESVVIIAGGGHIRADRGIPWYIRQRAPDLGVITVAFVETVNGKTDPAAYGPRDPAGKPAADFVAFAAPATRDDPCKTMRERKKS